MAFAARLVLGFQNYAQWPTTSLSTSDLAAGVDNNSIDNLADPVLGRPAVFASDTTAQFDVDLGSALAVQLVALLHINLPGAQGGTPCTVTITGSSDAAHTSNVYGPTAHNSQSLDTAINGVTPRNLFRVDLGSEQTARYWRILLTLPTSPLALSVGHLYLGPGYQPAGEGEGGGTKGFIPLAEPPNWFPTDESGRERGPGDTDLGDLRYPRKGVRFKLARIPEATAKSQIFSRLKWAVGSRRDVLVIDDPTATAAETIQQFTLWGWDQNNASLDLSIPGYRETSFELLERL